MFRPRKNIIRVAVEQFKKNIQIGNTGNEISFLTHLVYGPGSSFGIATDYGLDGPGIGSR
jgi:hypothetical protein